MIILVTIINLYYKPNLDNQNKTIHWFEKTINPITKSICPLQGFKCPTNETCDCKKYCSNGTEFVPFHIVNDDERIYVMNKKLYSGMYCLPKGVNKCNLKTNYHIFSLAGWSCLPLNEVIFKGDKKQACKNEEAENNNLNILWDFLKNEEVGDNVDDYYEPLGDKLRYGCKCQSKSLGGTPMISVFPFVCSVDYCLRDIPNPYDFMGWNGEVCECGPFFHLDPNDKTSPCKKEMTRLDEITFTGRVDCMTQQSFIKQSLFCPTTDEELIFKEWVKKDSSNVANFVDTLKNNNLI